MIDTEFWFDISRVILFGAFSLAVSWAMVFAAFCFSKLAWADFQRCYSDVKELNSLRLLPAELSKREASLAKAEERVKKLEAELAKPKHENQAASSPEIKYRFDPIEVPKEQNWFSEQWAMYSYIRKCYRCAPNTQKYLEGLQNKHEANTSKTDEVAAATQEQNVRLGTAEAQIKELKAQVTKSNEAAEAADALVKELMATVAGELGDLKQQVTGKIPTTITRLDSNMLELKANHTKAQTQIKELKTSHGGTEVQINHLKAQFMEMKTTQSKQAAKGLAQHPSSMEAEDHLLCSEEPTDIKGQANDISQLEIATGNKRDQSCVTVAEQVKKLEVAEKKVEEERLKAERRQSQSDFAIAIREEYDVVQVPGPNEG
jgi:hypothetical protein